VITTRLGTVRSTAKETTHESIPRRVLTAKNCLRQVLNLRTDFDSVTDLDSVVVRHQISTLLRQPLGQDQLDEQLRKPPMSQSQGVF
jgi:hypothetical protein